MSPRRRAVLERILEVIRRGRDQGAAGAVGVQR